MPRGEVERIEYEVAWFPPDKPDTKRIYTDQAKAEKTYDWAVEQGYVPMMHRREVIVTEWVMVRNAADWAKEPVQ